MMIVRECLILRRRFQCVRDAVRQPAKLGKQQGANEQYTQRQGLGHGADDSG
jgi:hypothetical protein